VKFAELLMVISCAVAGAGVSDPPRPLRQEGPQLTSANPIDTVLLTCGAYEPELETPTIDGLHGLECYLSMLIPVH